jgi:hypothetical protein
MASDAGRAFAKEEAAARDAKRAALARELAQVRAEAAKARPALVAAAEKARERLKVAQAALAEAEAAEREARGRQEGASSQAVARAGRLEKALRETAPASIGEFIRQCRHTAAVERDGFSLGGGPPYSIPMIPEHHAANRAAAAEAAVKQAAYTARQAALAAAVTAAEALALEPLTEEAIEARLAELRRGWQREAGHDRGGAAWQR